MKKVADFFYHIYFYSLFLIPFGLFLNIVSAIFFDIGFGSDYEYNLSNIVWIQNLTHYIFLYYVIGATPFILYHIYKIGE